MKALCISGGGSKGAFAGGIAQYLIQDLKKDYQIYAGTSTGALLVPLLAINKLDKLKQAYTNITQKDIFTLNPFKIQNNNGQVKIGINYINVFKNTIIKGQKTFGDSTVLRNKTIPHFVTYHDYEELKQSGKNVIVCTTNATLGQKEYKSCLNYNYEDFMDWIYCSSCAPPFMSLVNKDKYEYTDGGVMETIPIQQAIDKGATEIDIIILKTKEDSYPIEKIRNVLHWIYKITELLQLEISKDDVQIGKLIAINKNVKLNIYYTPRNLTNNSLIFDKKIMEEWWAEGYQAFKTRSPITVVLKKQQ